MRSIKCVIIGDGAVGKTSLLISYTTNTFPQDYIPTVFDNYSTTIALSDPNSNDSSEQQVFKLNLWDTAGQEEYDRLRPLSYPQTDIFIICFSVNEPNSFQNVLDKWFPEIKHNTNFENMELFHQCGKYPVLLVGTKYDLRDDEHEQDRLKELNLDFVSKTEIDQMVNKCGFMGYVECSAATQFGVRDVFEKAVQCVVFEPEQLLSKTNAASSTTTGPMSKATKGQTLSSQNNMDSNGSQLVQSDNDLGKQNQFFPFNKNKRRRNKSKCTIF